jgi:hypothetical protein
MDVFRKKSQRIASWFISSALLVWGVSGCSGHGVKGVGPSSDKDLPQELIDRFEVKEAGSGPAPSPVPSPSISPSPVVTASPAPTPSGKPDVAKVSPVKVQPAPPPPPPLPAFVYPNRRPKVDPIWVGEKTVYEITYFGMAAGDFTLDVLPYKEINGRKVYHVKGHAVSSKVFSLFYRLDDMVETFLDFSGLFSHRFHVLLDETKQARDSIELYDHEKAQTFYWNRWDRKQNGFTETKEYAPIPTFGQDSLSALYYMRTQPLPTGGTFSFPVYSEGKSWEAVITVVRREWLETPLGRVRTVVLKPDTKYQGILQKRGDSFVWLTDDDRRYCVRLEAKVRIGTVVAELKKVEPGNPPQ